MYFEFPSNVPIKCCFLILFIIPSVVNPFIRVISHCLIGFSMLLVVTLNLYYGTKMSLNICFMHKKLSVTMLGNQSDFFFLG